MPSFPVACVDYLLDWMEFQRWFRFHEDCAKYLVNIRWANGPCPHYSHTKWRLTGDVPRVDVAGVVTEPG